jgi:phospholipid transport system substrate-binding protein
MFALSRCSSGSAWRAVAVAWVMGLFMAFQAQATEAPEALIQRIASEVIDAVKADPAIQSGDIGKVVALVDDKIMPYVNFTRMTASAVGRFWRQATPAQRQRLEAEFKTLLVRTYAGALGQVRDQTLALKPMRSRPEDTEVVVRSELRGRGEPVQLDYRMEKTAAGWKVYDLNVLGVWLVDTYRTQFSQEINARGIDGLIETLAQRNRSNAGKAG